MKNRVCTEDKRQKLLFLLFLLLLLLLLLLLFFDDNDDDDVANYVGMSSVIWNLKISSELC